MDTNTQKPVRRRSRIPLAPWERTLRRIWPPLRLMLLGSIGICIAVLLISLVISTI